MKHIDEDRINDLLTSVHKSSVCDLKNVLRKAASLRRLTLKETALLLAYDDPESVSKIFSTANYVKEKVYGRRIVIFAPLYISNFCTNNCLYCGFKADNPLIKRKALTTEEVRMQTRLLLAQGHKRILMVCGEAAVNGHSEVEYYLSCIQTIYHTQLGQNRIRRVNVNCAPLSLEDFKKLKKSRIGTYQLFQETYHEATYRKVHPVGPKSDPDNRIMAIERAISAGIDDIGMGVLFGLYDYKFEILALLSHIEYLEKKFGFGPHTISVPRIEPAKGADFSYFPPYPVSDYELKRIVAILRLSVPYTGLILSTRESPSLRDSLVDLGVSQMSAGSRASPGGYSEEEENESAQFVLNDRRSLKEIVHSLIKKKYLPSFCTACYRRGRTGKLFMGLAKPGLIKQKCDINALLTLKEYLQDFSESKITSEVDTIIVQCLENLSEKERTLTKVLLQRIQEGERDVYI